MTAKELRQAADSLHELVHHFEQEYYLKDDDDPDSLRQYDQWKSMARHILATVRDDDDEIAEQEWIYSLESASEFEVDTGEFRLECHDDKVSLLAYDNHKVTKCRVREICRGLGIVLKEKTC